MSCGYTSLMGNKIQGEETFCPDVYSKLFDLEQNNFWFRYRSELIEDVVKKQITQDETRKVIEIGCGTGYVLSGLAKSFPAMRLSASDIYPEALEYASSRVSDVQFYLMDIMNMPFVDEFDIVLVLDVLEHISDDKKALSECNKILKGDGTLIITVPQHPWLWSEQDVKIYHKRRYTRSALLESLRETGFGKVYVTSFISLLLPFMVMSRCAAKVRSSRGHEHDPVRELMINDQLNSFLYTICSVERRMINTGVRFCFGGSLLCVARKISR